MFAVSLSIELGIRRDTTKRTAETILLDKHTQSRPGAVLHLCTAYAIQLTYHMQIVIQYVFSRPGLMCARDFADKWRDIFY